MSDKRPIGIFDSGLGGLTVVKEIQKVLPHEDLIYLGDTARVPYGTRSKEIVTKFSLEDANFLIQKGVKCIVIACNTSSALAGTSLKNKLKVPVFEVITPALKEAKKISKGKIGVIGTRGTINSGAHNVDYAVACPLLVPFIEEGEIDTPALKIILKNYLKNIKGKVDTLILGCTHYPIIEKLIKDEMGKNVILVDPGKPLAAEVLAFLTNHKKLNDQNSPGKSKYFVTDLSERFTKVAEMFLGKKINNHLKKAVL